MNKIQGRSSAFVVISASSLLILAMAACEQRLALSQDLSPFKRGDEFIPYYPIGCLRIERSEIGGINSYSKKGCSRGGDWSVKVNPMETNTKGVIYINDDLPERSLIIKTTEKTTQIESGRFWCSVKAPGFQNAGRFAKCTKNGWIPSGE